MVLKSSLLLQVLDYCVVFTSEFTGLLGCICLLTYCSKIYSGDLANCI